MHGLSIGSAYGARATSQCISDLSSISWSHLGRGEYAFPRRDVVGAMKGVVDVTPDSTCAWGGRRHVQTRTTSLYSQSIRSDPLTWLRQRSTTSRESFCAPVVDSISNSAFAPSLMIVARSFVRSALLLRRIATGWKSLTGNSNTEIAKTRVFFIAAANEERGPDFPYFRRPPDCRYIKKVARLARRILATWCFPFQFQEAALGWSPPATVLLSRSRPGVRKTAMLSLSRKRRNVAQPMLQAEALSTMKISAFSEGPFNSESVIDRRRL